MIWWWELQRATIASGFEPYIDPPRNFFLQEYSARPLSSGMDQRSKSKKAGYVLGDEAPDSLVTAIAGEILAPENLNLLIPVSMFIVPPTHPNPNPRRNIDAN